jgi:hypothetical protein
MLGCMKKLAALVIGTLSVRVARNVARQNRRRRRLRYLPR